MKAWGAAQLTPLIQTEPPDVWRCWRLVLGCGLSQEVLSLNPGPPAGFAVD